MWSEFIKNIGIFFYTHSPYFCKKSSLVHSPDNEVFVKYQAQEGGFNPNPPCVRPWMLQPDCDCGAPRWHIAVAA